MFQLREKRITNYALFTSKYGNPSAGVTLARGLSWHLHISSQFQRRNNKAVRVTLELGETSLTASVTLALG